MKLHQIDNYFLDPPHKITVALIGCGGTGSQVLSILARMNLSMIALGHPGLHVSVFDDDVVSEANVGRQLFSYSEINLPKVKSLVGRFNRFYGTNWEAIPKRFQNTAKRSGYNIYITCIDDYDGRFELAKDFKKVTHNQHSTRKFYWMDFGNTNKTGQMILGSLFETEVPMPCFDEWASLYPAPAPSDNTPSCSLADALEKQDLMINSTLANMGMQILWRLFREAKTPYHGVILNLESLTSNPIPIL